MDHFKGAGEKTKANIPESEDIALETAVKVAATSAETKDSADHKKHKFSELEREISMEDISKVVGDDKPKRLKEVFIGDTLIITITRLVAFTMAAYQIYTSIWGPPINMVHRPVHLAFSLVLLFLAYGPNGRLTPKTKLSAVDIIGIVLALVMVSIYIIKADYIMSFIWYVQPVYVWTASLCIIVIILALISGKRMVGKIFIGIVFFFIAYAWLGPYLPGVLQHRGIAVTKFIDTIALIPEGVFGAPLQVCSTYIFNFILFGAFLKYSKAGQFFIDLAMALAGASRGGPAKVAVFSSASVGTISGSVVANVLTTGVFTIPMMKKMGYKPEYAAAVEAAASTGGMIMPPVMGATAFVVAELSGTPYLELCKHAAIPAVLYFFSLVIAIDFEASKLGLKGLPKDRLPNVWKVLKYGWFKILPLVAIIAALLMGYSPLISGIAACTTCVVCSWFDRDKENRMGLVKIFEAMIDGSISCVQVTAACSCAGIVVGIVSQTGLGYRMGSIIMSLSGGLLPLALILGMITALILGMGLTVTPAYIIQAALVTPVLIMMGLLPVQAHLFAFYYSCLCAITPPVAIGAFAAAGLAEAHNMKTGLTAVRIAIAAFIIPYMFAFGTGILLIGSPFHCIQAIVSSIIGIIAIAGAAGGYLMIGVAWWVRILLAASALMMMYQGTVSDLIGLGLFIICILLQFSKKRKEGTAVSVA